MKITLLTGEFPPMRGGVADYTSLIADGLKRLGVDVSVLTSTRARSPRGDAPWVSPDVVSWGTGLWGDVARHVEQHRPDILHVQYQTGAYDMRLGINLLPWINRIRRRKARLVVTFHDLKEPYLFPKIGPARHLATMALAAGSDAIVITNSDDLLRVADRNAPGRSRWEWGRRLIAPIPIGSNIPPAGGDYDRSLWRARFGARDEDLVLAYFGFLSPAKGVDILAAAFETLVERGRPVRLLMIGAPTGDTGHPDRQYENSLRTFLDQPKIRGRVTWTGFLASSSVGAYLSAADACCLPFRSGASLRHGTLVAAIAQGLPIVTTRAARPSKGDPLPRLESGKNALLVAPNDSEALVTAIERLIAEPSLREGIAAGARDLAANFEWETIARDTLRLYQKLCESG